MEPQLNKGECGNPSFSAIQSMTGFGRAQVQQDSVVYLIEIRAVNSRFLDINLRGMQLGAALEHQIRQRLQRDFKRGKLDVFATAVKGAASTALAEESLFLRLIESGSELLKSSGLDSDGAREILTKIALERSIGAANQQSNGGGSLSLSAEFDEGAVGYRSVLSAVDAACVELRKMRSLEGERLRIKLMEYIQELFGLINNIGDRSQTIAAELLERSRMRVETLIYKLRQAEFLKYLDANKQPESLSEHGLPNDAGSLKDAGSSRYVGPSKEPASSDATQGGVLDSRRSVQGEWDEARLLQELALIADRTDVSEELVRLSSHVNVISELLRPVVSNDEDNAQPSKGAESKLLKAVVDLTSVKTNSIGKQIDFILQEILRELNTLSVKCQNLAIVNWCVQGKLLVEQMKEQIQNVE